MRIWAFFYSGGSGEPLKVSERMGKYFHLDETGPRPYFKLNKSRTREVTMPHALLYWTLAPPSRLLSFMLPSFLMPPDKCVLSRSPCF